MTPIIDSLLASPNPSIQYLTRTELLQESPESSELLKIQREIPHSQLVQSLFSERLTVGTIPYHPYAKWYGAHWVLVVLADIGYPAHDSNLLPLREQVLKQWLDPAYFDQVLQLDGRYRRCASQQGNALYAMCRLGLDDERCEQLVELLLKWQWSDGGWNCDKKPTAHTSSVTETLVPLRGLIWYEKTRNRVEVKTAIESAVNFMLDRSLYLRKRDGQVMDKNFVELHYPCYWHYDILFGLKVMKEGGFLPETRCQPALQLLQSKQLADGGFPAEAKYFFTEEKFYPNGDRATGYSLADWQPQGKRKSNPFITIDALSCLGNRSLNS